MPLVEQALAVYERIRSRRNGQKTHPPGYEINEVNEESPEVAEGAILSVVRLHAYEKNEVNEESPTYHLVRRPEDVSGVCCAIGETAVVGLDLETEGLDPRKDRVRLLSVACDTVDGGRMTYLVDCFAVDPSLLWEALAERPLVIHNALFDLQFLAALGFEPGTVQDTMLLSQLLDGARRPKKYHTLAECVRRELGRELPKEMQQSDWSGPLSEEQLAYAARDVEVLVPLYEALARKVQTAGLARVAEIERRCLPAVVWLSRSGVPFDRGAWQALARGAEEEARGLEPLLDEAAPARPGHLAGVGRWNWSSPEQVKEAFRLAGVVLPSTEDDILAGVDHPLADLLRRHRSARKRADTYGTRWLKKVGEGPRVYAQWRQIGADSGRMSCASPNLQNLPGGEGYRRCFRAPHGRVLVKADYSQIELRIAAKVAGDRAMTDAYVRGEDLHTLTARRVLAKDDVSRKDRKIAKSLNFGLIYGAGTKALRAYPRSSYGVELTEEEAASYRRAFFNTYPGLATWHRKTGRTENNALDTRTLAGRRRAGVTRFTEKLNTPVQGTGADGMKLALALLWERRHQAPGAFPVLAVHDEIVLECDAGKAEDVAGWLQSVMVEAMAPLLAPVPVEVTATIGKTWGGN